MGISEVVMIWWRYPSEGIAQWMEGEWESMKGCACGVSDLWASWNKYVLRKQNKLFIENDIMELKLKLNGKCLPCVSFLVFPTMVVHR